MKGAAEDFFSLVWQEGRLFSDAGGAHSSKRIFAARLFTRAASMEGPTMQRNPSRIIAEINLRFRK